MVPWGQRLFKYLAVVGRRLRAQLPLLGWVAGAWLIAVAAPVAELYPRHGLGRPVVWALIAAGPVGALAMALGGQPWHTLAAGLVGCALPAVACAPLWQGETPRPLAGLALAALLAGAVNAASSAPGRGGIVARLVRWPKSPRDRWLVGLAAVWVMLAWFWPAAGPDTAAGAEWRRAARVALATVLWSLVAAAGRRPIELLDAGPALRNLALRRAAWLALLGGLLWLWRAPAA